MSPANDELCSIILGLVADQCVHFDARIDLGTVQISESVVEVRLRAVSPNRDLVDRALDDLKGKVARITAAPVRFVLDQEWPPFDHVAHWQTRIPRGRTPLCVRTEWSFGWRGGAYPISRILVRLHGPSWADDGFDDLAVGCIEGGSRDDLTRDLGERLGVPVYFDRTDEPPSAAYHPTFREGAPPIGHGSRTSWEIEWRARIWGFDGIPSTIAGVRASSRIDDGEEAIVDELREQFPRANGALSIWARVPGVLAERQVLGATKGSECALREMRRQGASLSALIEHDREARRTLSERLAPIGEPPAAIDERPLTWMRRIADAFELSLERAEPLGAWARGERSLEDVTHEIEAAIDDARARWDFPGRR